MEVLDSVTKPEDVIGGKSVSHVEDNITDVFVGTSVGVNIVAEVFLVASVSPMVVPVIFVRVERVVSVGTVPESLPSQAVMLVVGMVVNPVDTYEDGIALKIGDTVTVAVIVLV